MIASKDSTDMIVSKELLGKVGSAAEWGDSIVMENSGKAEVFPAFLALISTPELKRIPAQPSKSERAISG